MADKPVRIISKNDMNVIMTQFLDAAREINVAMCLFSDESATQANLNSAMHSVLIGAEQCRQLHATPPQRLVARDEDGDQS